MMSAKRTLPILSWEFGKISLISLCRMMPGDHLKVAVACSTEVKRLIAEKKTRLNPLGWSA
ncbi:hypothetical protein [Bradyrhizobium sp. BR 1433]|uniref:hypothetical protein n=1 Tax=Bradyrhizobium sp. BR 1433 TaxID=3447967 RepID=UPI003EE56CE4